MPVQTQTTIHVDGEAFLFRADTKHMTFDLEVEDQGRIPVVQVFLGRDPEAIRQVAAQLVEAAIQFQIAVRDDDESS